MSNALPVLCSIRFGHLDTQLQLLGAIEAQLDPIIVNLRTIPILDVAKALELELVQEDGYDYYVKGYENNNNGLYDAIIYPELNRWEYADDPEEIYVAHNYIGLKSNIELVMFARHFEYLTAEQAIEFLCKHFPKFKI